ECVSRGRAMSRSPVTRPYSLTAAAPTDVYSLSLHDALPISGEVVFSGSGAQDYLYGTNGTLTIGAGVTIHGPQSGTVGQGGLPLVLQGTVVADQSGQTITISGSTGTEDRTPDLQSAVDLVLG